MIASILLDGEGGCGNVVHDYFTVLASTVASFWEVILRCNARQSSLTHNSALVWVEPPCQRGSNVAVRLPHMSYGGSLRLIS